VGDEVYPLPPLVTVIMPTRPFPIDAIPTAPDPPPPLNETLGATVYPNPGFISSTP